MLYCQLILLKGEGNASLTCRVQPHLDARVTYCLRSLPRGGTLLVGDGTACHAYRADEAKGDYVLPPLEAAGLWAAYLSPAGKCLAWGTADGRWHEYLSHHLYSYTAQKEAEAQAEQAAQAALVQEASPLYADLTDFGVVDVLTVPCDQCEDEAQDAPPPSTSENEAPRVQPVQEAEYLPTEDSASTEAPAAEPKQPLFAEDVERLLAVFDSYPPYAPLMQHIEGSRWVSVGESEDDAYLLGLLHDSAGTPTHLVYGVRGQRNRPFTEDAEWLPEGEEGEGYWLVYHNL